MKINIQVKGTLPLIAEFLNVNEKKIYDVFGLNEELKFDFEKEKEGGEQNEITNKGKAVQSPKDSI